MQRRKFIAGMGSLAAAGAAGIGTGAFTSVQAQRNVAVSVATDENAYLGLEATGDRATVEDGQLKIDFSGSSNGARGLNPDSRTAFTDLFTIENQGDNDVVIAVGTTESAVYADGSGQDHVFDNPGLSGLVYKEESGGGVGLGPKGGFGSLQIDSGGRVDLTIGDQPLADERTLEPGDSMEVDLSVITGDDPTISGDNNRISVLAAEPNSDRSSGGNGT
jgi:hypothetical protein